MIIQENKSKSKNESGVKSSAYNSNQHAILGYNSPITTFKDKQPLSVKVNTDNLLNQHLEQSSRFLDNIEI
jgi:hypothetical protein